MKIVNWKVRAIRGATTATSNSKEAIREAVTELLDEIEAHNQFDPEDIVSVIFTTTKDLDAIFPAAIARERSNWDHVPLLDVQQMHVEGSLERCIRILIQINTPKRQIEMYHSYLRKAKNLRPDWSLAQISTPSSIQSHRF
nr:chorismate mutase [Chroococcus sp. FPU101]